jgi:hypothetical protein
VEVHFGKQSLREHFCSQEHLEETNKFLRYAEANVKFFFIGLLTSGAVGISVMFLVAESLGGFIALAGIAVTIGLFPFATPQTNWLLGLRRSIILVRGLAVVVFIIGLIFLFIPLV